MAKGRHAVNFNRRRSRRPVLRDAFPNGSPASLLPLFNLQIWGAPTSKPMRDPKKTTCLPPSSAGLHYDDGCKCKAGGLLLGDLKALITANLPIDLRGAGEDNPLLRQYQNSQGTGSRGSAICGPNSDGFEKMSAGQPRRRRQSRLATPDPEAAARRRRPGGSQAPNSAAPRTPAASHRNRPATLRLGASAPSAPPAPGGMNVFSGATTTTNRDLKKTWTPGLARRRCSSEVHRA